MGEGKYKIKKNKDFVLVVVKKLVWKSMVIKYMFLFCYHNAGQNYSIRSDW